MSVLPDSRTITYVSGDDELAIDYWMASQSIRLLDVTVGGPLVAQHRPVQLRLEIQFSQGASPFLEFISVFRIIFKSLFFNFLDY